MSWTQGRRSQGHLRHTQICLTHQQGNQKQRQRLLGQRVGTLVLPQRSLLMQAAQQELPMQKLRLPRPWCLQGSRPARPRPQTCGWRPFLGLPLPCIQPQLM